MQEQNKYKNKLDDIKGDYERLFSTDLGKTVLEDIKKSAFFKQSSFSSDALVMAKNEGIRTLALHIDYMATPISKEPKKERATK